MTSLDKLNENISAEDYQLCQRVWEDNDMKTMKEFLTWYNNKDVEPMLEAIDKMFQFNQNRHIDMFKDGISVPGLTLKYMATTSRLRCCSTVKIYNNFLIISKITRYQQKSTQ